MAAKKSSSKSARATAVTKKSGKPDGQKKRTPLRITDTTLRDAHQSLWATRMRTSDIMEIIDTIDNAGFYSLEVWGGATYDVCLRFLRENPWERLRMIKAKAPKTPLQMLLRGQNILGYRNYPDDLLERFIALACENGVDIFRIFDALNDSRNLEKAITYVKKYGGHAQGTLCYTISPVHTVEAFVGKAKEQVAMGVESIAIKDMAGILSPIAAEKLVSALVKAVNVPIQLHCHATSGMAVATYVEGVRAGAGAIDCAISVMSGSSSQPPHETMLAIINETDYHADLDIDCLRKMCRYFTGLAPQRMLKSQPLNPIDPEILIHHIPGGMISNLRGQLEQQGALDRLEEVLAEVPKVRADMGYPPLVTPTSQIVGVQAVLNVLAGKRYEMVTQETKDYVKGLYGRAPSQINPKIQRKILGKEKPLTSRPADGLQPILPSVTKEVDPALINAEEDIVSYCLFPEVALDYFRWRQTPVASRPPTPADLEREKEDNTVNAQPSEPAQPFLATSDYNEIKNLLDKVNQLQLSEVTIRRNDLQLSLKSSGMNAQAVPQSEHASAAAPAAQTTTPAPAAPAPVEEPVAEGPTIDAPLTGTFYRSAGPGKPNFAEPGQTMKAAEPVCIVEAMKLFNQIKAPQKCKVVSFLVEHGTAVTKGQPLVAIELL